MTAAGPVVDRWWWQLSLTAVQVAATIIGVYLAAGIALRHERKARRAEAAARAADALRPTLSRIARVLDSTIDLEVEEAVHELDDDRQRLKPPRERLRDEIRRAGDDYRALYASHAHHLTSSELAAALDRSLTVALAAETVLSALPSNPDLVVELAQPLRALRDYVARVDQAFRQAALEEPYELPLWSPRLNQHLVDVFGTWFGS